MKETFTRSKRLLSKQAFTRLYKQGLRYSSNRLLFYYFLSDCPNAKFGITISKKWGKSHERNRFKRVVREAYRKIYFDLPFNIEINVHPKQNYRELSSERAKKEFNLLINKICEKTQSKSATCNDNN